MSGTAGDPPNALNILLHYLRDLSLQHLRFNSSLCCCREQGSLASDYQRLSHFLGAIKLCWIERKREENTKGLSTEQPGVRNLGVGREERAKTVAWRSRKTFIDFPVASLAPLTDSPSMGHHKLLHLFPPHAPLLPPARSPVPLQGKKMLVIRNIQE